MAEYPGFKHGALGEIDTSGAVMTSMGRSRMAFVYIGTAPVHLIEGGAANVNRPMVIKNMAEARAYLGYSDNWADYTLCEAMHVHFNEKGVGPLVFIDVLDPARHVKAASTSESKTPSSGSFTISDANLVVIDTIVVATKVKDTDYTVSVNTGNNTVEITEKTAGALGTSALTVTYDKITTGTATLTPANGRVTIVNAEDAILDTLTVSRGGTPLTKGTDYTAAYDFDRKSIVVSEVTSGSLGTTALTLVWEKIDPSTVTQADVIGSSDGYGLNTGICAVKSVYGATGYIPAFMAAPGFSSVPAIHNAMYENSQKIGGHWYAWMFVDMPIVDATSAAVTLANAPTWKETNGYNKDNEDVYFPLVKGTDGKTYHISVLAAANFQELFIQNNGIPYMSASNTECGVIENLYLGEGTANRIYDDEIINRCLNANGINSAAYVGGRWVIWGMFAGSYSQNNATNVNVNDTALMMLYYLTNDFQHRRNIDIDKPMRINDLKTIVSEEQARVDALLGIGALTYGKVELDATVEARADVYQGDFRILFNVTNVPLAKSLTAIAFWTAEGFEIYFAAMSQAA